MSDQHRLKITIKDTYPDAQDMAEALREIASLVEGGFSSGHWPHSFDVEAVKETPQPRTCFIIPADASTPHGYIPAMVTEGKPGYALMTGNGPGSSPWYWGDTYEQAKVVAAKANKDLGLTEKDVREITLSSYAAGVPEALAVEPAVTHDDNDSCSKYPADYGDLIVYRGDPTSPADVEAGDVIRDPKADGEHQWRRVVDVFLMPDSRVHVQTIDGTCERCKRAPITDEDCGLCERCTEYNAGRVVL